MMKALHFALVSFLLIFSVAGYCNPSTQNTINKTPLLTHTVKIFSELEIGIVEALRNNNETKLKSLIADDFEMRQAWNPVIATPFVDWQKNSLMESSSYTTKIEKMIVHDLNETAIVTFLWTPFDFNDEKFFVVDVWRRDAKNWKLAIRYINLQTINTNIPGFMQNDRETEIEKRY